VAEAPLKDYQVALDGKLYPLLDLSWEECQRALAEMVDVVESISNGLAAITSDLDRRGV
jgi:hypothetical protein